MLNEQDISKELEATIDFDNPRAVRYASLLLVLKYPPVMDKNESYVIRDVAKKVADFILYGDKIATIDDFDGKGKRVA